MDCVRLWNHHRNPRPLISWCPHPSNKLKWNGDGSSRGKPGEAGIGGVLRNEFGTIKAKFAASVGIRDSNEAWLLLVVGFCFGIVLAAELDNGKGVDCRVRFMKCFILGKEEG